MLSIRKKYLLATVSIAALAGFTPTNAEPVAGLRPVDRITAGWAGLYIGVHGGAARHTSDTNDLDGYAFARTGIPGISDPVRLNKTSALVGAHIGYNWQSRNLVYGVEADFSGVFGGTANFSTYPFASSGSPTYVHSYEHELNWLSTLRARIGMQINSTMPYVTGGLAVAGIKNRWGLGFTDNSGIPFSYLFQANETRLGWTIGAGIEQRIADKWTARIEALYMKFGHSDDTQHVVDGGGTEIGTFRTRWENTVMVARVGLTRQWNVGD